MNSRLYGALFYRSAISGSTTLTSGLTSIQIGACLVNLNKATFTTSSTSSTSHIFTNRSKGMKSNHEFTLKNKQQHQYQHQQYPSLSSSSSSTSSSSSSSSVLSRSRSSTSSSTSSCFTLPTSASSTPHILIIDGYSVDGRNELVKSGASMAGKLYESMLKRASQHVLGVPAQTTIFYPSDNNSSSSASSSSSSEPSSTVSSLDFKHLHEFDKYDAVAWTGCSLCVHDQTDPRVQYQLKLARHFYQMGMPQFGSCWALQIAVTAAGGQCAKNPRGREMGIGRKVSLTQAGRSHLMYHGKSSVFDVYTSHEDEVTKLPPGSMILAQSDWSQVQAATIRHGQGEFWAVQYHPEYSLKELAMLSKARIPKLTKMGFFKSHEEGDKYVEQLMEIFNSLPTTDFELLPQLSANLAESKIRRDLMWKLGIDGDVLLESVRCREVENWVEHQVGPFLQKKKKVHESSF